MDKKIIFNEKKSLDLSAGFGDQERILKIIKLIGRHKKVLDLGCNKGEIGKFILKNHNQVYGIDIVKANVKQAVKKGLIAVQADVEKNDFPFKNIFFDVVLIAELLEHIFDPDDLLRNVRKKLKPKGKLIITTPNLASFGRRLLLLIGQNPLIETRLTEEYPQYLHYFPKSLTIDTKKIKPTAGHIRYFVKDSLFRLINDHHFKITCFGSDQINFTPNGMINSTKLAKIFPSLGKTLIIMAIKQ